VGRLGVHASKRCSSSRVASRAVKEVKVVNRSRSSSVKVNIRSTSLLVCVPTTDTNITADARASILSQILEPDAADRLGRIRLVKQSRAEDVENRLIMLARSGQLKQKISEAQLKDILSAMSEQQEKKETVKVSRRKGGWDDDDLEDLLNDD
jgi:programmed cell death protein 5